MDNKKLGDNNINLPVGRRQLAVSMLILLLCSGVFFGLIQYKGSPIKEIAPYNPPVIKVKKLFFEDVMLTINSQGVVRPSVETLLVAEISGVVKTVSPVFVSGAVFSKGELLASIDDRDYNVALRQAEASLAASEARLAEEVAKAGAEKTNWLRSGRKIQEAPDLLMRKPYIAEAKANVKAASAQLDKAKRDLEKTFIRAPYDGMVRERFINPGQFLSMGKEAGSIFSIDFAEVRLPIKSSDLGFLNIPIVGRTKLQSFNVLLEQRLGRRLLIWDSVVDRVEGVIDQLSRMHFIVVKVTDPYGIKTSREVPLKSGSFVYAKIQGETLTNLFSLPRSALYSGDRVLVLDIIENHKEILRFRNVDLIYVTETDVYISGGVIEGEQVCLTPMNNPIEGMQVNSNQDAGDIVGIKQATMRVE